MTQLRRKDDITQVKSKWVFLYSMAKEHPLVSILTPSLALIVIILGVWFIMNVSYTPKYGWRVTPRINLDIDINKELKK